MKADAFWKRYRLTSKRGRIKYTRDGDWWMAECPPLLEYGVGDTRERALRDLLVNIHDRWRARLGSLLKAELAEMRKLTVRRERDA